MGRMRNKVLGLAAVAFVASLGCGAFVYGETDTAKAAESAQTPVFAMVEGAQVRTADPAGIRFVTDVNDAYKLALAETYPTTDYTWVWGTVLTFTDAAGTAQTVDAQTKQWLNNDTRWYTALVDIPVTDYLTEITAESYIKVYAADDAETAVYTDTVDNAQTRSIAYSASWALNDGYTADILSAYVAAIPEKEVVLHQEGTGVLAVGEEKQLGVTVSPAGYGVVWSSDNNDIATVDKNGKVTAVGSGVATITATFGDASDSYNVEVIAESDLITGFSKTNGQWSNQNGAVGQVLTENNRVGDRDDVYGVNPIVSPSSTMYMRLDNAVMGKLFANVLVGEITFDLLLSVTDKFIQQGTSPNSMDGYYSQTSKVIDGTTYYVYNVRITRARYTALNGADMVLRYTHVRIDEDTVVGSGNSTFFYVDNLATVEYLSASSLVTEFYRDKAKYPVETLTTNNTVNDQENVYGVSPIKNNSATMYITLSADYLGGIFADKTVKKISFDVLVSIELKKFTIYTTSDKKDKITLVTASSSTGTVGGVVYYAYSLTITKENYLAYCETNGMTVRYTFWKDTDGNTMGAGNSSFFYVDNLQAIR